MSNLEKLYIDVLLRDKTQDEIDKIRKKLVEQLSVELDITADQELLDRSIRDALEGRNYQISLIADPSQTIAALQNAIEQSGISIPLNGGGTGGNTLMENVEDFNTLAEAALNTASLVELAGQVVEKFGARAGIIGACVAAIGAMVYTAYEKYDAWKDELKSLEEGETLKTEKDIIKLYGLLGNLKEAGEGTGRYADTLSKINSEYGRYLPQLLSEKDSYDEIEKSIESVVGLLEKRSKLQLLQAQENVINTQFAEGIDEAYENLKKRVEEVYGKDHANEITKQIAIQIQLDPKIDAEEATRIAAEKVGAVYQSLTQKKTNNYTETETVSSWNAASSYSAKVNYRNQELEKKRFTYYVNFEASNDPAPSIEAWRAELMKQVEGRSDLKVILEASANPEEFIQKLRETYNQAQEKLKTYEPMLTKWQIKPEIVPGSEGFKGLNPFQQETVGAAVGYKNSAANIKGFAENNGISLGDGNKPQFTAPKEDKFTNNLKGQIELIKVARSYYEKLVAIGGEEYALEKMKSRELYQNINPAYYQKGGISKLYGDMLAKLGKRNTPEAVAAKKDWTKNQTNAGLDEDYDNLKENLDKRNDEMDRFLSDYSKKWSLYRQIYETTGDQSLAANEYFGPGMASSRSEGLNQELQKRMAEEGLELDPKMGEEEAEKFFGSHGDLLRLWQEAKAAVEEEEIQIKIDTAKIIGEMMSTQDKIGMLELQKKDAVDKASSENKEKVAAYYDQQLNALKSKLFESSDLFKTIFEDAGKAGSDSFNAILESAKELDKNIKNGTENKDADGNVVSKTFQMQENGETFTKTLDIAKVKELEGQIAKLKKQASDSLGPFKRLWKAITGDAEEGYGFEQISQDIADATKQAAGLANEFSGMFSALGNEGVASDAAFAGEMLGNASDIAGGIASGNYLQAAGGVLKSITSIAAQHDKKLDKAIQKSQLEVKRLGNAYKNLQSQLERQLGNMADSQTEEMIGNLKRQKEETESMMRNEQDKKKTDDSKIEDYKQQIIELDEQIKYFYEDLAKERYSIDLKGWADQFSDSIVSAWQNGEDAAEAFGKTASSILASVANDMIKMAYVEPLLEKLRGRIPEIMGDGVVDSSELTEIANSLLAVEDAYIQGTALLDSVSKEIESVTGGKVDLKGESSSSETLSGSIAGVTEDTASLLGGYINGMRADLAMQKELVRKYVEENVPVLTNTLSLQLAELKKIELNTQRSAVSTESIASTLNAVVNGTKRLYVA